mmetsp:Transcript_25375/g.87552  ORF Transcript_25375/g.87552 Transcript_25375/m.87552 type:complete len:332 (+) Transcript_25375:1519-2514(+)
MTKGVRLRLSMEIDSRVCCSSPCMRSMTTMAMSQSEEPRDLKFENASWPGVSMTIRPGKASFAPSMPRMSSTLDTGPGCVANHVPTAAIFSFKVSWLKNVAPICCVMPPASPSCTLVWRILSRSFVLPVSTWPMMQQMGERRRSALRLAKLTASRATRLARASSFLISRSRFSLSACSAVSASINASLSASRRFFSSRSNSFNPACFNASFSRAKSASAKSSSGPSESFQSRLAATSGSAIFNLCKSFASPTSSQSSAASSQLSSASSSSSEDAGSGAQTTSTTTTFFFSGLGLLTLFSASSRDAGSMPAACRACNRRSAAKRWSFCFFVS